LKNGKITQTQCQTLELKNAIWLTKANGGDLFATHHIEEEEFGGNGVVARWKKMGNEWKLQEVSLLSSPFQMLKPFLMINIPHLLRKVFLFKAIFKSIIF